MKTKTLKVQKTVEVDETIELPFYYTNLVVEDEYEVEIFGKKSEGGEFIVKHTNRYKGWEEFEFEAHFGEDAISPQYLGEQYQSNEDDFNKALNNAIEFIKLMMRYVPTNSNTSR